MNPRQPMAVLFRPPKVPPRTSDVMVITEFLPAFYALTTFATATVPLQVAHGTVKVSTHSYAQSLGLGYIGFRASARKTGGKSRTSQRSPGVIFVATLDVLF